MRDEFDRLVYKPAVAEDPSLALLNTRDFLNEKVSIESAQDLEFTNQCMQEALRYCPPSPTSQIYFATEDVKLGKYYFKKGDQLCINMLALHHNPKEWQRPMEMLPDRFNHESPLSLTPEGKKRHNCSNIPFHGGMRVCFGKTLAESNLKILATYMTQKFDMKFEDPRYETQMPLAQVHQSNTPDIWLKLTARQE